MKRLALPLTDRLIRAAVVLAVLGMLLLVPILATISALAVGLFMLSSMLIVTAIALYVVAVVRELRSRRAI